MTAFPRTGAEGFQCRRYPHVRADRPRVGQRSDELGLGQILIVPERGYMPEDVMRSPHPVTIRIIKVSPPGQRLCRQRLGSIELAFTCCDCTEPEEGQGLGPGIAGFTSQGQAFLE